METIVLAYICSAIAIAFAIYISYLFIYKDLKYKKFALLITAWGSYTHSPLLAAIDMHGLSSTLIHEVLIAYILAILTLIIGYTISYLVYTYVSKAITAINNKYCKVIFIMVGGEYMRGVVFSLLFLGEQSNIGLSNTSFSISYALVLTPLSPLAYFGHIYYLTFILFLIVITLFETVSRYRTHLHNIKSIKVILKVLTPFILLIIFIVLQLLYIEYKQLVYSQRQAALTSQNKHNNTVNTKDKNSNWPDVNILSIPSDIPMHYDMNNALASNTYNQLHKEYMHRLDSTIKSNHNYDMAILPENVSYMDSLNPGYKGPPILNGLLSRDSTSTRLISSSYYVDNVNSANNYRNKSYLFPFYEYTPYITPWHTPNSNMLAGGGSMDFYIMTRKGYIYKWTTIICSEFFSYDYMHKVKSGDYDFVVSQGSLSALNHSKWLYANVLLGQIVNANYLAVPIVNIYNAAPSYMVRDSAIHYYSERASSTIINLNTY